MNYLQGYENKKVYDLCFYLSIITFVFAILSLISVNIIVFVICTWIALLFGGAMMPTLTGIVITSLPQHLRASGNSLQLFIGTLFGYLPSPYIYGALQDLFKDGGRKSMVLNMSFLLICIILLGRARHIKYNNEVINYEFIQNLKEDKEEDKNLI